MRDKRFSDFMTTKKSKKKIMRIEDRKSSHIDICLKKDVEHKRSAGFENVELAYSALPEVDFEEIDSITKIFGKKISFPFYIEAITGGFEKGKRINKELAKAAEANNIGFALGSQRAMIENPKLKDTYYVRDVAPTIPIIGNIGAVNLKENGMIKKVESAVKTVDADALAIHLNPLQEIMQPEGEKNFKGCLDAIREACDVLDVPIIVKEVGAGINEKVASELEKAGASMINIAGVGGTSWAAVEILRHKSKIGKKLENFREWGIPTIKSLYEVRKATKLPIIVSGGVRSGIDLAKGIALGASYGSAALPFLKAWNEKKIDETIKQWKNEFQISMFLTGSRNIKELYNKYKWSCIYEAERERS